MTEHLAAAPSTAGSGATVATAGTVGPVGPVGRVGPCTQRRTVLAALPGIVLLPGIASVAPTVTSTSVSGSRTRPVCAAVRSAIAWRSSGTPVPGGYWLWP